MGLVEKRDVSMKLIKHIKKKTISVSALSHSPTGISECVKGRIYLQFVIDCHQ